MQKDKYELSWRVIDAQNINYELIPNNQEELHNAVTNEVTNIINTGREFKALSLADKQEAKETLIGNELAKIVSNASSELIYSGILPNVDLKYRVSSGELKEDIILNRYTKDFKVSFLIYTNELSAKLEEGNIISFYDKNDPTKIIFTTAAPFMYDQKGAYSDDVKLILKEVEHGYELTLTPKDSWLSDQTRSYPVVIDPFQNRTFNRDRVCWLAYCRFRNIADKACKKAFF